MTATGYPTTSYVLDLAHSLNRATIEGAQPGVQIAVLVVPEFEPDAKGIKAVGKLSADGQNFTATVTTDAGVEGISWGWAALKSAIDSRRHLTTKKN